MFAKVITVSPSTTAVVYAGVVAPAPQVSPVAVAPLPTTSRHGADSVTSSKPAGRVSVTVAVLGSTMAKARHSRFHMNSSPGCTWLLVVTSPMLWFLMG